MIFNINNKTGKDVTVSLPFFFFNNKKSLYINQTFLQITKLNNLGTYRTNNNRKNKGKEIKYLLIYNIYSRNRTENTNISSCKFSKIMKIPLLFSEQ